MPRASGAAARCAAVAAAILEWSDEGREVRVVQAEQREQVALHVIRVSVRGMLKVSVSLRRKIESRGLTLVAER